MVSFTLKNLRPDEILGAESPFLVDGEEATLIELRDLMDKWLLFLNLDAQKNVTGTKTFPVPMKNYTCNVRHLENDVEFLLVFSCDKKKILKQSVESFMDFFHVNALTLAFITRKEKIEEECERFLKDSTLTYRNVED